MYCEFCGRKHNGSCECLKTTKLRNIDKIFLFLFVMGLPPIFFILGYLDQNESFYYLQTSAIILSIFMIVFTALYYLFKLPYLALFFNCHQYCNRSFKIGSSYFPICYRCSGIYLGIFSTLIASLFYTNVYLFIALGVPMTIDGLLQKYTTYESTTIKRFITGFLFGPSLVAFYGLGNYLVIYVIDYLI